jgi:hypothetical protein
VAALTNAVHANAATARLEAFIVFLLWVRAATINDSPDHPIDLDQGSGSKKPREGYPAGFCQLRPSMVGGDTYGACVLASESGG